MNLQELSDKIDELSDLVDKQNDLLEEILAGRRRVDAIVRGDNPALAAAVEDLELLAKKHLRREM